VIVFGSSLALAQYVTLGWSTGAAEGGAVEYGLVLILTAGALASPWLLLAYRCRNDVRRRWVAIGCGVLGHGAAGILCGAELWQGPAAPSSPTVWLALGLVFGGPFVLLLAGERRRQAVILASLIAAAALALWAAWIHAGEIRYWCDRIVSQGAGPLVGFTGAVLVFGAAAGLLAAARVRGRRLWLLSAVLGLASFPVGWLCFTALAPEPPGPVPQWARDGIDVQPEGIFRDTTSDAVLGWRWVRCWGGTAWRPSMVIQPPCRVEGRAHLPADGRLRLFVAVPDQDIDTGARAVLLQCTARDAAGRTMAERRHALRIPTSEEAGIWEELVLEVPHGTGEEILVELALEPEAAGAGAPSGSLPAVAIASASPDRARTLGDPNRNCLMIVVAALRADRLHCYGWPQTTSPHVDQLADEGALFERAISTCSWTVPSLASVFTGTYVSTHGMSRSRIPGRLSLPTMAEQFRQAGLRTAAVSSNSAVIPKAGFGAGFQEFVHPYNFELLETGDPPAGWVTDRAIELLRGLDGQRFFLYLHYMDSHNPYEPPPEWKRFGDEEAQRYLGEIAYCDSEIGRLLAELDALGHADDTLVVFLADHGEQLQERGHFGHAESLHREEVHVPLILRLPGRVPAGKRVGSQVRTIDVYPTVAEVLGLSALGHLEGESLLPLLEGDAPALPRVAVSELYAQHVTRAGWKGSSISYDDGRYKLVLHLEDQKAFLYDVRRDPDERTNLAAEQPDLVAAMQQKVRQFLDAHPGHARAR